MILHAIFREHYETFFDPRKNLCTQKSYEWMEISQHMSGDEEKLKNENNLVLSKIIECLYTSMH